MDIDQISKIIVESAVIIHRTLSPGLLESVYQTCLTYELTQRGLSVQCEVPLPIEYAGITLESGYRIDMLVENCIIIENKSVEQLLPIHEAQLLTYLKLKKCWLGFLLNWNSVLMKDGIRRLVSGQKPKQT